MSTTPQKIGYFSQTHCERLGGPTIWLTPEGEKVRCTAVSLDGPWGKEAYFPDAVCVGPVDVIHTRRPKAQIKKKTQQQWSNPARHVY